MKARLPLIAALAVALFPMRAAAQAWVSNPDFSEGVGIRAGNFELHPSIGGEFGYDSNYFRTSKEEGVIDVFKLRVTPSITLSTLGAQRRNASTAPNVAFSSNAYAAYHEVIPAGDENIRDASRRNVGLGIDAKLNVFPQRKVGFDMLASFARIIDTNGSSEDLAGDGFNRGTGRAGAGVTWRPGGGLFEWRGGYQGTYHYFEKGTYNSLTNLQHDINTRGRWRFLPRTALLFDTHYVLVRYTRDTAQTSGDLVRARVGLHGLVTYHLALMGLVGWSTSFYKAHAGSIAPRQFDSIIAQAEARWFVQSRPNLDEATISSGLTSIALGYQRSFNNSYFGSFYQRDRGSLQVTMFLLGAAVAGLEFGVSRVAYPFVSAPRKDSFSQLRLDGRVFAEYRLTDTFALNTTVQYDQVNSEIVNEEHLDYKRVQAYVGARLFW